MNVLHIFSVLIIISGSLYPVFALGTTQVCDANSLPHYGPHNSSHIYIKDTNGSIPYIPLTYHTAVLHDDDVWNTSTQPRIVQVTLTIQNQDTGQQVFNQTQILQMQACSGPESVKWRFVPIQIANYIATVSDNRDKENMIFNSMLDATKSQTVSSPLEQLSFGIDSHNVVCKQNLQLVIKLEDGSPACVKPDTASKLIEIGWGVENIVPTEINSPAKTTIFDTGIYPFSISVTNTNFTVNYNISGGQVKSATLDMPSKSVILSVTTSTNGTLVIDLPRALIDPKIEGQDSAFIVLNDGQEVLPKQIATTGTDRVLDISFQSGISQIQIIAPVPIQ